MQNNCLGFAQNWDNVCTSDFGGLCCAPGMENRRYIIIVVIIIIVIINVIIIRYMVEEYPESWMAHEGYCKDQGGALVAFETRAEMDCLIQYVEDKFPVDRYPYNWAIGLASSFRYKGGNCKLTAVQNSILYEAMQWILNSDCQFHHDHRIIS